MITICIPGEPVGKGRPRVSTIGGHARMFTPAKTKSYENHVKEEALASMRGMEPLSGAVALHLELYLGVPASYPKGKRAKCLSGEIRPTKKPDIDNVVKAICDAFNGAVWIDDVQVVDLHVTKRYAEEGCVLANVSEIGPAVVVQQSGLDLGLPPA